MATLKQAEAVCVILRNKGEAYDFNEIWDWDGWDKFSEKASKFIGENYFSYYKVKEAMESEN